MKINRLSKALGAEVLDCDISSIGQGMIDEINRAFLVHQLLVFRDQKITPEAQVTFSERFGPIESRPNRPFTLDGMPEITILSNRQKKGRPVGIINAGDFWHTDLSFSITPSRVTFLYALEAADEGGNTEWSNIYLAYENLSKDLKQKISGLRGIHVFDRRRNSRGRVDNQFKKAQSRVYGLPIPDAVHPLVRTHPDTGRKSLYICPRFVVGIDGMKENDAQPLLDLLFEHRIKPEFRYLHEWSRGDFLMWDNPSLIHIGRGHIKPPGIRHMHRTMVLGDKPF